MEARKSLDLLYAGWGTGEPLVLVLECKGLRTRSWDAQGQEKMDIPLKKRELSHASFFFLPFRSIWALGGLNDAQPGW